MTAIDVESDRAILRVELILSMAIAISVGTALTLGPVFALAALIGSDGYYGVFFMVATMATFWLPYLLLAALIGWPIWMRLGLEWRMAKNFGPMIAVWRGVRAAFTLLAVANGAAILILSLNDFEDGAGAAGLFLWFDLVGLCLLLPITVLATLTVQWFSLMRMPAEERDRMSTPRWMLHGYSVVAIWIAATSAGAAGLMLV